MLGLALLWWATEQWELYREALGATQAYPAWRALGWLLTMTASGAAFGVLVGLSRPGSKKVHEAPLLVAGLLPLALVVHYWIWPFGWSWFTVNRFTNLVYQQSTAVAASTVLGFIIGSLALSRFKRAA